MWAAYAAERAGKLDSRFGCATPEKAALKSHVEKAVVEL